MQDREIRHALIELQQTIRTLDEDNAWKQLMSYIPKDLNNLDSEPKYNSRHVSLIENEGEKLKRSCAEILFEEWGTSGKIRPTLLHLLIILKKACLYKAADIVAALLGEPPVERPLTGPAARVDTSLSRILAEYGTNNSAIESFLNNMPYPSTISNVETFNNNLDYNINQQNKPLVEPNKILSNQQSKATDISTKSAKTALTNLEYSRSDMIQFSQTQSNQISYGGISENIQIPAISMLLNNQETSQRSLNVLNNNEDASRADSDTNLDNSSKATSSTISEMPQSNEINMDSMQNSRSCAIPNISMLQGTSVTQNSIGDFNMPNLSILQNFDGHRSYSNTDMSVSRQTLNTELPHFAFIDLERTTNHFDKHMYSESSSAACEIGSGGFGTVYLAHGLLGYPVAIKKLKNINLLGDDCDSLIFKHFKTEVEIISKYKHENILLLLGYSCDTPNYCLVYEYVEGGTLRDNVANSNNFQSQIRLNIALGIGKGIEHLHYAFEPPLIHRDIKSTNILLTKERIPKLCDFGLVREVSDQNATSNIIGTTAYMAPEAFRGYISIKMDVFSFGVVLLELLTGLPPTDKNRPKNDLISHVDDLCEDNGIEILLDARAGKWNSAQKLYEIARRCLNEERHRPIISDVVKMIQEII